MYTLCGLKSSSDRLSLHMGNFDYLDDKNLFLVPLFCAAKVGVILEWCLYQKLQDIQRFALALHDQVDTAVIKG